MRDHQNNPETSDRSGEPPGDPVDDREPMQPPTAEPLTGATVTLRPLEPAADIDALYTVSHGDPEAEAVWTFMPYGPFADAAAMRIWLADCADSPDPLFRTVVDHASGEPVGMVSYLNIVPAHRRLELGHIWYAPTVQRGRVNTETIYLLLAHCLDRLGCRRVEWKCNADNARSRAAALRLGFRFEGIFRQHMIVKGHNRDTAWYALVDTDWPTVRANMERWLYGNERALSLTALNAPLVADAPGPGID